MNPTTHRNLFVPSMAGLVALAWVVLAIWESSPYGRYIKHNELAHLSFDGGWQPAAAQAVLYVAGWVLMTVAMMLPTTLPLIEVFRRLVRQRADRARLVALLVAGYLAAWLAFGVVAHFADWGLHEAFESSAWLQSNAWLFGAGPLLLAGAYQFSPLKYRCLDECRSPLSFVMQHWGGGNEAWRALRLGVDHGVFCVGCCWALMLLMFAVGTGNIGWMLALAAVMAIEKNVRWGKRLSAPLGVALLVWGVLLAAGQAWNPTRAALATSATVPVAARTHLPPPAVRQHAATPEPWASAVSAPSVARP